MPNEQNTGSLLDAASATLDHLDITGVSEVGRGASATVWGGTQHRYARQVAVKIFRRPLFDQETRNRFNNDCQTLGRLSNHPNIAKLFDNGFDAGGHPFIVMGLYEGGGLQERLLRAGAMPIARVLRIGVRLSSALQFAHSHSILHRSIKPANVLLMTFGEPMLSDFHLTGTESNATSWTEPGGLVPNYTAPEVGDGIVDERSDIWSLAATLYALLLGRAPYPDPASGTASLDAVGNRPLPALERSDVPGELIALLAASMAKDPAERPQSAALFGAALQRVQRLAGLAVTEYVDLEPSPVAPPSWRDEESTKSAAAFRTAPTGVPPTATRLTPAAVATTPSPRRVRRRPLIVAGVVVAVVGAAALAVAAHAAGHHQPKLLADVPPAVGLPALPSTHVRSSCHGFTCTFNNAGASLPIGMTLNLTFPGHHTESITTNAVSHDFAAAGRYVVLAQVVDGNRRGEVVRNVVTLRNWSRSIHLTSSGSTSRRLLAQVRSSHASCGAVRIRLERRTNQQWVALSTHKVAADGTLPLVAPRPGSYRVVGQPTLVSDGRCQGARSQTVEIVAPTPSATAQTITPTEPTTPVTPPSPPATPRKPASPPP